MHPHHFLLSYFGMVTLAIATTTFRIVTSDIPPIGLVYIVYYVKIIVIPKSVTQMSASQQVKQWRSFFGVWIKRGIRRIRTSNATNISLCSKFNCPNASIFLQLHSHCDIIPLISIWKVPPKCPLHSRWNSDVVSLVFNYRKECSREMIRTFIHPGF